GRRACPSWCRRAAASGFLIPAHVDKPVREWGCAGGASGPDRGRCDGLRPDGPDSVVRRDSGRGAEHPGRRGGAAWWGREVGGAGGGGGGRGGRWGGPPGGGGGGGGGGRGGGGGGGRGAETQDAARASPRGILRTGLSRRGSC